MTENEYKQEAVRLRPLLKGLALKYMGDGDDADDMVQDAMLKLWLMRDDLRSPADRLACVLVRNLCVDRLRRRPPGSVQPLSDNEPADDDSGRQADRERIDRMMAVVDKLPDAQQVILRLRHMQGMEMAEIAELTGCSEVAVRKALSRARQAVRDKYNRRNRQ